VLVADIVMFAFAHWLTAFGGVVNIAFAVVASLFAIVVGRRVLNRKQL